MLTYVNVGACEVCPYGLFCAIGFSLGFKIHVLVCLESIRCSLITAG